jgi:hypothetical protein
MKRLVLCLVAGALLSLVPSAQGQFFFGRRPTVSPGPFGFGGSPFLGSYPYGYPYGGGLFGPGTLPGPFGVGGTPYNVVPTIIAPGATQYGVTYGTPNDTGHPTRFAQYSRFFSNQGGFTIPGYTAPVSRTTPSQTGAAATPGGIRSGTMPSKTGSGATPPTSKAP